MSEIRLYHNPRCSKSRQALSLLEQQGHTPTVILYLETPPDAATLKAIIRSLGLASALQLVRHKEPEYQMAGLTPHSTDAEVIAAMVRFPKLIERPIAVLGKRAVIGRPPENVLELL
ncbi:MAG: arsenate reductase (glutaredoxin) [Gammaproteobacteria bacterium HGW-Gammaproteobacteria-14]|nr:MAG: arsenate reductase (glutaredoxin) [Gammaproteobacteria bacterium HGW-Gammaproteobacteria-14]